jgi:hypothetical protein
MPLPPSNSPEPEPAEQQFIRPFYIFFLVMRMGISQGFVTVALPFLLTKNGFPVALTAGIVAIGLSANLWRFMWGPVVDMSLSLRKWFWIGISASIALLLLLCFIPFTIKERDYFPLLSSPHRWRLPSRY